MNILQALYFLWMGGYGHILNFLKQALFQGKDVFGSPLLYLKQGWFMASASSLLIIGLGTWFFDAYIRQKLHLSQIYGYSSLISAPISIVTLLVILKLSEQHLSDKVVWWAAFIWAVGIGISMVGAGFLIRQ